MSKCLHSIFSYFHFNNVTGRDSFVESNPEVDIASADEQWFLSDQGDDSVDGSDPDLELSTCIPLPSFSLTITRTFTEHYLVSLLMSLLSF